MNNEKTNRLSFPRLLRFLRNPPSERGVLYYMKSLTALMNGAIEIVIFESVLGGSHLA